MSGVVDTSALNAERTADPRRIGVVQKIKAYVALTKPRVIELLLVTTAPAMVAPRAAELEILLASTTLPDTLKAFPKTVLPTTMAVLELDKAPPSVVDPET